MEKQIKNKIIQGDCLDPKKYPDMKFDLILFDPPFMPMSQSYKQIRDKNINQLDEIITPKNYPIWWEHLCDLAKNYLKSSGWFVFKSDPFTSKRIFLNTIKYFDYGSEVIWDKRRIGLGYYIRKQHEHLEFYRPKGATNSYIKVRTRRHKLKSSSHGGSKGKAFSSILSVSNFNSGTFGTSKQNHINQTPLNVWRPIIDYFCPIKGSILDLCAGTGSIGMVAKQMGREYHGIELDKTYVNLGNFRIEKTNNNRLDNLF